MSSVALYRPTAAASRWWAPLEAAHPGSAARGPAPSTDQRADEQAAALAAIRMIEITHPREALASAGQALQRALNRGDVATERLALQQALAAAHAQTRQADEVLAAAWSLLSQGACALPRGRERHQALALAAAVWGASGRPCMVLAADDEGAATAARAGSTLLADLGLQSALAPSDAAGAALREAYAADVVYVPARRLAADLARDRRERGGVNADAGGAGRGFADWRVPNKNELASLVNYRCNAPSIQRSRFPGTPATSAWTSSPLAAGLVWYVDFTDGNVGPSGMNGSRVLRLVRAGQ